MRLSVAGDLCRASSEFVTSKNVSPFLAMKLPPKLLTLKAYLVFWSVLTGNSLVGNEVFNPPITHVMPEILGVPLLSGFP